MSIPVCIYRVPRFIRWREIFRGGSECGSLSSFLFVDPFVNFGRARRGNIVSSINVKMVDENYEMGNLEEDVSSRNMNKFQVSFTEAIRRGIINNRKATITSLL